MLAYSFNYNSGTVLSSEVFYMVVLLAASKLHKVPVNKMVRTDSSNPAGRLHVYLQPDPRGHLERNASLTAVR